MHILDSSKQSSQDKAISLDDANNMRVDSSSPRTEREREGRLNVATNPEVPLLENCEQRRQQNDDQKREGYKNSFSLTDISEQSEFSQIVDSECGSNPLTSAAAAIFTLASRLQRFTYAPIEKNALLPLLVHEINAFSQKSQQFGYHSQTIIATRYILATFLDEIIANTAWGKIQNWQEENLLAHFYQESNGGEKFFFFLDQFYQDACLNNDALELIYLCLSLGFTGKYRETNNENLNKIKEVLYQAIMKNRGELDKNLFIDCDKKLLPKKTARVAFPYTKALMIIFAFAITLSTLMIFYNKLQHKIINQNQLWQQKYNTILAPTSSPPRTSSTSAPSIEPTAPEAEPDPNDDINTSETVSSSNES